MDVIKAAVQLGLKAHSTIALSAEESSHTYLQLLQSALSISSELKTILSAQKAHLCGRRAPKYFLSQAPKQRSPSNGPTKSCAGPRVGIIAKPSAEFVAGMWATWLCRGVAVPLALSYPESELLHVLTDAEVSVVFGTRDHEALLQEASQKVSSHFFLLPRVKSLEEVSGIKPNDSDSQQVLDQVISLSTIEGSTPGLIIYTSGTTGKPKGVVHSHSGMNAQVEFLPKFSVTGVWKRWSDSYPSEGVKGKNATTVFTGVPTMYTYLLEGYKTMDADAQKVAASAARRLRLMMCGSSALPLTVMQDWEALTGHRLLERYGMTEFVMALSNPYNGARKAGTVGVPLPGVEVKIVEDDPVVPGVGELYVKSLSMFQQYWHQPKVTEDSFEDDGFFKTGDTATRDNDGYYIILGRSSVDIMKVGGFKLSALEIEAVLLEHPYIAECAVLGLPDVYYGEVICVVAVLSDEARSKAAGKAEPPLTLSQLQGWAKERLAPYKAPSRLEIWEKMPRNVMGKINKKELKKLLTS